MHNWIIYGHLLFLYAVICLQSILYETLVMYNVHDVLFTFILVFSICETVIRAFLSLNNCFYGTHTNILSIFWSMHANLPMLIIMILSICVNFPTFPFFLPLVQDFKIYVKFLAVEIILFFGALCYKQAQRSSQWVYCTLHDGRLPQSFSICFTTHETISFTNKWHLRHDTGRVGFATTKMQPVTFYFLNDPSTLVNDFVKIYRYNNLLRVVYIKRKEVYYYQITDDKDGLCFVTEFIASGPVSNLYQQDDDLVQVCSDSYKPIPSEEEKTI